MKTLLRSLFLVDSSFQHKVDPLKNAEWDNPPGPVDMDVEMVKDEGHPHTYAVKLRVKVDTATCPYVASVTYAAILKLEMDDGETPPDMLEHRVLVTGASMLFPYCRELISNLSSRTRFGPVWLDPTNFNTALKPNEMIVANAKAE